MNKKMLSCLGKGNLPERGPGLKSIAGKGKYPGEEKLLSVLEKIKKVTKNENPDIRPRDRGGQPGGLILLKDLPLIIVPDLHARVGYMRALAEWIPPGTGKTVSELLEKGRIQVVCAGDGFHSEGSGQKRWLHAYDEYKYGFQRHKAMDSEMRDSLLLMLTVMNWKIQYPDNFHFLKGNHENIMNETSDDNRAFAKFAAEGEMVKQWAKKFLGNRVLSMYYDFEKFLPVMAVGKFCIVTHAEPRNYYTKEEIINCYDRRKIIFDLTWTDNGESEEGTVESYLREYFPSPEQARMYGGHRPVSGKYKLRAGGNFVQIHNPDRYSAVFLNTVKDFEINLGLHYIDKGITRQRRIPVR